VVSLKAVFAELGETHGLAKKQAQAMQAELVTALTAHLKYGARIRLPIRPGHTRGPPPGRPDGAQPGHGEAVESRPARRLHSAQPRN